MKKLVILFTSLNKNKFLCVDAKMHISKQINVNILTIIIIFWLERLHGGKWYNLFSISNDFLQNYFIVAPFTR